MGLGKLNFEIVCELIGDYLFIGVELVECFLDFCYFVFKEVVGDMVDFLKDIVSGDEKNVDVFEVEGGYENIVFEIDGVVNFEMLDEIVIDDGEKVIEKVEEIFVELVFKKDVVI